jgi:hypothetical protein
LSFDKKEAFILVTFCSTAGQRIFGAKGYTYFLTITQTNQIHSGVCMYCTGSFATTIQVHPGGIRTNALQFLGGKKFFSRSRQGDQICKILAQWEIVNIGQFLYYQSSPHFGAIFPTV